MQNLKLRIWLVLLPAMSLPALAALFYFVFMSEHALARWLYAVTKVFTLIWPVISVALITRTALPTVRLRDPAHRHAAPIGLVTGFGIAALMWALMLTPVGDVVMTSAPKIRVKAQALGILNHYWTYALFLSLIHSLLEEYYWRWFVYGHLRRVVRKSLAHALAGASFAAHHIVVTGQYFPPGWDLLFGGLTGVGGVLWSVMYEKQGTLAGAWVCHVIVDLGILGIGHRLLFGSYF